MSSKEEALTLGLSRNLRVQGSQKRVEEARLAVLRNRALFLPKATFNSGFSKKDAVFAIDKSVTLSLEKDPGFFFGYTNEWSAHFQVDQPIYDGGRNRLSYQIAKRDHDLQVERDNLLRLNLEYEITRSYYATLLAQQILTIRQELSQQNKRLQDDLAKRHQAGDISKFEKLRVDVSVNNLYPEILRCQNDLQSALAQLKNVLGLEQDDQLLVSGAIVYLPEDPQLPDAIRKALASRPEVHANQLTLEIAEHTEKINRLHFFPILGAFYTQDLRSDALNRFFDGRHSNWIAGVTLTLPLFEGGAAYYSARESRLKADQIRLRERQIARDVQVEVVQALLELQRAAAGIKSQKENVAMAEEALTIANTSYANGLVGGLMLLDTQLALQQARINYTSAVNDYLVGQARYRRVVADVGKVVTTGAKVFTIADLDDIWMRAVLQESDKEKAGLGKEVWVVTPSNPQKRYEGKIAFVLFQSRQDQAQGILRLRINIRNHNQELRPGMSATAIITY